MCILYEHLLKTLKPGAESYSEKIITQCDIAQQYFMRLHKGEFGAIKHVLALQSKHLLIVPKQCFFYGSFMLFVFRVCHAVL